MGRVVAVAAVLGLAACAAPGEPAPDDPAVTLRLAETSEYPSLNPLDAMFGITGKIYDGLYAVAADGTVAPDLAVGDPEPDASLTTWTVRLQDDVVFSDGSTLDAQDVAATYTTVVDPRYASPLASSFPFLVDVTAVDPTTVEFRLSEPYAAFPSTLTVGVAPAEALTGTVLDSPLNREPVGSGPYVLEQWQAGESLTLAASPTYRGEAPAVERVVVGFVLDENVRTQRLRSGDFDGAQLSPRAAQALEGVDGLTVVAHPSADYRAVTLPQSVPALADPAVRRALNLAVDREAMVEGILRGYGAPAATPFTVAQGDAFDPDVQYEHDTAQAAALLAEAGWAPGAGGVREKDGARLSFPLMYFAEDALRRDLALAVASDLAEVGVQVDVEAVDSAGAAAGMGSKAFVLGGGDQPYDPDTQVYTALHSSYAAYDPDDAYSNPSQYVQPEVDRLLDAARRSTDPDERAGMYRDVQQVLADDPPMITLVVLEHTYAARGLDGFDGVQEVVEPHEHGVAWGPWWNVETWQVAS
ncbi:ABC transporter substrate-binding protein [Cellulomonas xiejunii]|uniref:ABC transporter substrate-binding protein n=1 Tax=Cellulomonas xiejunii TaxID=2968083 RepID=A0ABY5KTG2_9CELL|nr:ABC transporter substrate-binding protein [Cellulomonas xiejunii]MCC2323002.1 ABC transporter substrate-binding protein [Cellulomonas xiejunii]UUI73499.1 ABC transporter substrate-binding protein [Cellulomonas xiejunii]